LILLLFFSACTEKSKPSNFQYLFLGHIYDWRAKDDNEIDRRFGAFNFEAYDQIWLGGDLCARTNEAESTLNYLDSIFDLSAATTHWSLGNHDVGNGPLEWIEARTKRKTYYTTTFNGLTLAVLNTNEFHHPNYTPKPDECALLEGQLEMLEHLADTIQSSSHLILLHHYNLLTNELSGGSLSLDTIFNLYRPGLQVNCAGTQTFEQRIYPVLKTVQEKGVQVILVSGDLGQRSKSFEYQTAAGIWFLGSGINNSSVGDYLPNYVTDTSPDKILIFEHDVLQKKIYWRFEFLK